MGGAPEKIESNSSHCKDGYTEASGGGGGEEAWCALLISSTLLCRK